MLAYYLEEKTHIKNNKEKTMTTKKPIGSKFGNKVRPLLPKGLAATMRKKKRSKSRLKQGK